MELITGINKRDGRFEAIGMNSSTGEIRVACGSELSKRGLPSALTRRPLPEMRFSDWTPTDLVGYAGAFGVKPDAYSGHQAWALEYNGKRYVVPALAVLRAVFKPRHAFLGHIFRFQALEEMCEIRWDGERAEIARGRGWHVNGVGALAGAIRRLSWFYCFPSARAMWSSVHSNAVAGRLGLSLPQAHANVIFFGRSVGGTFYVTKMTIMELDADEEAFEFAGSQPKAIDFTKKSDHLPTSTNWRPPTRETGLLLRDGIASLSDAEWAALEPLFLPSIGVRPRVSRRALVNAVLQKQAFGTSWKKTVYYEGIQHTHAEGAYWKWVKDGRWQMLTDALNVMRADDSGETSRSLPAFAKANANLNKRNTKTEGLLPEHGDPRLSDSEWAAVAPMFEPARGVKPRIPRRTLVDAVLLKQCLGTSWRKTSYPEGVRDSNALEAHGNWVKDGRWSRLVDGLKAMRNQRTGVTTLQPPSGAAGLAGTATKA